MSPSRRRRGGRGGKPTAQQLRDRSWWTGPELFVLVDDYDLVVAGPTNPLTPLLEYLPQARDVGLQRRPVVALGDQRPPCPSEPHA